MTGPQHFAEAERLLAEADTSDHAYAAQALARAQVHATLAQTAATIAHAYDTSPDTDSSMPIPPTQEWERALSGDGN